MKAFLASCLFCTAVPVSAAQIGPQDLGNLRADIVVLGEVHDNPTHHANQAAALAALAPRAIVFEMLSPEQAARVTPDLRADAAGLGEALGWNASGWPDFAMYAPLFTAAPEAVIYGAALPRDEVRRAMADGAAAVFGPDAPAYGLDQALPQDEQAAQEAEQRTAHCDALPADMLPGMVAAQRLRDAAFARTAIRALEQTGGPVAVITGSGHARTDRGVPAMIARAAPQVSVLSLGQLEAPADGPQPFDLWIVTEPTPREDPCAALR